MLDNALRGGCREVRAEIEIDEEKKKRAGRNEEKVPLRKSLVRVQEYCIHDGHGR